MKERKADADANTFQGLYLVDASASGLPSRVEIDREKDSRKSEATDDENEDLSSSDIDPLGEEGSEIVGS